MLKCLINHLMLVVTVFIVLLMFIPLPELFVDIVFKDNCSF